MKFQIDHDLHIHSKISHCSSDPEQTTERILKYAEDNNLKHICLTDHHWADDAGYASEWFYNTQNYAHIAQMLPLPQSQNENIKFHFGCEIEMDKDLRVGITEKSAEMFEFIIIPTTHLHFVNFTIDPKDFALERRAELYIERINALADKTFLPFHKIGLAHPTCSLIAPGDFENHLTVLDMISDADYREAYSRIAKVGAGFELNFIPAKYNETDLERVLRPYRIAKEVGCKFYMGSDAHNPKGDDGLENAMSRFTAIVDLLDLQESDKFMPF